MKYLFYFNLYIIYHIIYSIYYILYVLHYTSMEFFYRFCQNFQSNPPIICHVCIFLWWWNGGMDTCHVWNISLWWWNCGMDTCHVCNISLWWWNGGMNTCHVCNLSLWWWNGGIIKQSVYSHVMCVMCGVTLFLFRFYHDYSDCLSKILTG